MALAVMSTAFTSVAIATGFERRYGVLKRLGASPLPRSGLLAGKVGAVLMVEALQLALVAAVGLILGWQPQGGLPAVVGAMVLVVLGTAAFCSLALLLAGTLRAEATLAAANLVYLLLLTGGGVVVPIDRYPDSAAAHLGLLPSGALAEGLRDVLAGGALEAGPVVVLAVWAAIGAALTARTFRWE
jgi:ABC-2 type transport system permease protein